GPRRLLTREQILAISLDPPALLDERGGRQDHDGHRAHEALQQEERFVCCDAGEGSGAPEHRPDRDSRQHGDEHRRLALPEPERGPQEGKGAEEREQKRPESEEDRKSTRLNSSHDQISYAVFCLKKKKKKKEKKKQKDNKKER